jgi:hypothetical protein
MMILMIPAMVSLGDNVTQDDADSFCKVKDPEEGRPTLSYATGAKVKLESGVSYDGNFVWTNKALYLTSNGGTDYYRMGYNEGDMCEVSMSDAMKDTVTACKGAADASTGLFVFSCLIIWLIYTPLLFCTSDSLPEAAITYGPAAAGLFQFIFLFSGGAQFSDACGKSEVAKKAFGDDFAATVTLGAGSNCMITISIFLLLLGIAKTYLRMNPDMNELGMSKSGQEESFTGVNVGGAAVPPPVAPPIKITTPPMPVAAPVQAPAPAPSFSEPEAPTPVHDGSGLPPGGIEA